MLDCLARRGLHNVTHNITKRAFVAHHHASPDRPGATTRCTTQDSVVLQTTTPRDDSTVGPDLFDIAPFWYRSAVAPFLSIPQFHAVCERKEPHAPNCGRFVGLGRRMYLRTRTFMTRIYEACPLLRVRPVVRRIVRTCFGRPERSAWMHTTLCTVLVVMMIAGFTYQAL